jgi:hypothetical protein
VTSVRVSINEAQMQALLGPNGTVGRFRYRIALRVLTNSRQRVPVDTGYLRSTGSVESGDADTTRVAYRAKYALFVHNGTRYMRGTPYLTEALNEEMRRL